MQIRSLPRWQQRFSTMRDPAKTHDSEVVSLSSSLACRYHNQIYPRSYPWLLFITRTSTSINRPKGPLDYPAVADWSKTCEDDLERGRDHHDYMALSPVFAINGCTRIGDITRLTTSVIETLADEQGVNATIETTERIHAYAAEDVARVQGEGKPEY